MTVKYRGWAGRGGGGGVNEARHCCASWEFCYFLLTQNTATALLYLLNSVLNPQSLRL